MNWKNKIAGLIFCILSIDLVQGQAPALVLPERCCDGFPRVKTSADGSRLAALSIGQLSLWDVNTGALLKKWPCGFSDKFDFLPDSGLVICSTEGKLTYQPYSGNEVQIDYSGKFNKFSYTFLNDSLYGVAEVKDNPIDVFIFNLQTGRLIKRIIGDTVISRLKIVLDVQFSPDGQIVICTFADVAKKYFHFYNTLTGEEYGHIPQQSRKFYFNAIDSANAKVILSEATAAGNSSFQIWDLPGNRLIDSFRAKALDFNPAGNVFRIIDTTMGQRFVEANTMRVIYSRRPDGKNTDYESFMTNDKSKVILNQWGSTSVRDVKTDTLLLTINAKSGGLGRLSTNPQTNKLIFSDGKTNSVRIYDMGNGKLLSEITGHMNKVYAAKFISNNQVIVYSSGNKSARIWDIDKGEYNFTASSSLFKGKGFKLSPDRTWYGIITVDSTIFIFKNSSRDLYRIVRLKKQIRDYTISQNDRMIACYEDSIPLIYDLLTNSYTRLRNLSGKVPDRYQLSPDGDQLMEYFSADEQVYLRDIKTDRVLYKGTYKPQYTFTFSFDSRQFDEVNGRVLVPVDDTTWVVYSPEKNGVLARVHTPGKKITKLSFSPDGKRIAALCQDGLAFFWKAEDFQEAFTFKKNRTNLTDIIFAPDSESVMIVGRDSLYFLDVVSGAVRHKTAVKGNDFADIDFIKNKALFLSTTGELNLVDLYEEKKQITLYEMDNDDYLLKDSKGYYKATRPAARLLHYVTSDLKVISFEQLDVKYNRPDKLLASSGSTDTSLIRSYQKAWNKRIRFLNIDTMAFRDGYSVPSCDFTGREKIQFEQNKRLLQLNVSASDSVYGLSRLNIWVNETPVFGRNGIALHSGRKLMDTAITIALSKGANRIEVSAVNTNGAESYRMPLHINCTAPDSAIGKLYFIGIGIDRFEDKKHNLKYSVKDIRDMAEMLQLKYEDNIFIDTLFNEQVNRKNVRALKKKLFNTSVNDKVIVAYSGHGLLSDSLEYFLSTYKTDFRKPEINGLPYDELEDLMDSIPSRQKLLLIDACHSGEVDKEEKMAINKKAAEYGLGKGAEPESTAGNVHTGLEKSFDLMQALFLHTGRSTGTTIIAAAAGNQFALEGVDQRPYGIFTYSILEAMSKFTSMQVGELKKYVISRVQALTSGLQRPTCRNELLNVDWKVW